MNKMEKLDEMMQSFISDIEKIHLFLVSNFGEHHFLLEKNSGVIPDRMDKIKNSEIKSYYFHGGGALFKFKNYTVDVEFDPNSTCLAFTVWSFSNYCTKRFGKSPESDDVLNVLSKSEFKNVIERRQSNLFVVNR